MIAEAANEKAIKESPMGKLGKIALVTGGNGGIGFAAANQPSS